jgi:hypothetical protein
VPSEYQSAIITNAYGLQQPQLANTLGELAHALLIQLALPSSNLHFVNLYPHHLPPLVFMIRAGWHPNGYCVTRLSGSNCHPTRACGIASTPLPANKGKPMLANRQTAHSDSKSYGSTFPSELIRADAPCAKIHIKS